MIIIKNTKKTKISLNYLLFGTAYFPWLICWIFTSSYYKDFIHPYGIIKIWNYVGTILLIIKIFRNKLRDKSMLFVGVAIIAVASVVSSGNGNASFVFYSMLLIVAASDLDTKWIIKKTMWCQIVILSFVVVSSLLGIIPNDQGISYTGGIVRQRQSLGFSYTTYAPNFFLSIVIEWFYVTEIKKKINMYLQITFIMLINIFLYTKTMTRASFIFVAFLILVKMVDTIYGKDKVVFKTIVRNIYIIMAIASIGISAFYTSSVKWMRVLNDLLSQRLRFAKMGLINWGISIFGTSVQWDSDPSNYNYIDSSYVNILICYGGIILLIVIVGLSIAARYACKVNNHKLAVALTLWGVRAFVDPQLFLIWFNPFIFYVGVSLLNNYRQRRKRKEEKSAFNIMSVQ